MADANTMNGEADQVLKTSSEVFIKKEVWNALEYYYDWRDTSCCGVGAHFCGS